MTIHRRSTTEALFVLEDITIAQQRSQTQVRPVYHSVSTAVYDRGRPTLGADEKQPRLLRRSLHDCAYLGYTKLAASKGAIRARRNEIGPHTVVHANATFSSLRHI